ncbi:MAG: DUF1033 domain-containing protein, partial [Streptococcus sp.]
GYEKQTGLEIHRTCRIKNDGTTF